MPIVGDKHPKRRRTPLGHAVWLTGLPSSGKTSLTLLEAIWISAEVLDGDAIKQSLTTGLRFSREGREEQNRRIAYIANLFMRNGIVAIAAVIFPYRKMRQQARMKLRQFLEIYVSYPLRFYRQQDVNGLYVKAL